MGTLPGWTDETHQFFSEPMFFSGRRGGKTRASEQFIAQATLDGRTNFSVDLATPRQAQAHFQVSDFSVAEPEPVPEATMDTIKRAIREYEDSKPILAVPEVSTASWWDSKDCPFNVVRSTAVPVGTVYLMPSLTDQMRKLREALAAGRIHVEPEDRWDSFRFMAEERMTMAVRRPGSLPDAHSVADDAFVQERLGRWLNPEPGA